jgi:hypothetical protein
MFDAVLFDLDGTFADTAPGSGRGPQPPAGRSRPGAGSACPAAPVYLAGRARHACMPGSTCGRVIRSMASSTSASCVTTARTSVCRRRSSPASTNSSNGCERRNSPWGIVTNKAQRFTLPLLHQLGYAKRAACVVSGDSARRAKPAAAADATGLPLIAADAGAASTSATTCATSRPAGRPAWRPWRCVTAILATATRSRPGAPIISLIMRRTSPLVAGFADSPSRVRGRFGSSRPASTPCHETALILFAHGARDPEWAEPMRASVRRCASRHPQLRVELAFLEFMPARSARVCRIADRRRRERILVLPMFIARGGHLKRDVPLLSTNCGFESSGEAALNWRLRSAKPRPCRAGDGRACADALA